MTSFQTKSNLLPGTNYKEVYKRAIEIFKVIKHKTKRKPFIRAAYFKKDKIFFDYFWNHLRQKRYPDRTRRLKCFAATIDLLEHSRIKPDFVPNPLKKGETLYRFKGLTKEKTTFYVQIKETKNGQKQLISIFPGK